MVYSVDFRKKILETYLEGAESTQSIADRFKISVSTVKRIGKRYRETGKADLYLGNIGRTSKLDEEAREILKRKLENKPDVTLEEMRQDLEERCQVFITVQAIHYILKKLKITYKKKSTYASQRAREDVKKREEFISQMIKQPLEQMIFLDEAGAHLAMSKTYGRNLRGKRLVCACPYFRGSHYSMLSAIGLSGVTAALFSPSAQTGAMGYFR